MPFDVQDLSGTFSVGDIAIALALSFVLSSVIGWVYRSTHRNVSYSQSYVQTLVILGMLIAFSVVGLSASGLAMWWKRRPQGALGAPPLPADRRLGAGVYALIATFALVLPLVGASLVLVLVLESLWTRMSPSLAASASARAASRRRA